MERALQEKNRPLHRENFWLFSFILVDGTYKCIHCQRKMKKKMFRKIIFKPSSEATRRGLWMALVVPSPNCPSSLSPQENTSPTTTKKKNFLSGLIFLFLTIQKIRPFLTCISACHTMEGATSYVNDFFVLEGWNLAGSPHMVVWSMSQAVVISFTPEKATGMQCFHFVNIISYTCISYFYWTMFIVKGY